MAKAEIARPDILADIGGTRARFALCDRDGGIRNATTLASADFPDLASAMAAYLSRQSPAVKPARAALAVAGPVTDGRVAMTNRDWSLSPADLRGTLALDEVAVVNDFAAIAAAVPDLKGDDLKQVGGGGARPDAPVAVLGPGTGLGVSALIPTGTGWLPLATEGGHVTLAASTERESAVIARLRSRFGHVSAERALSGPGLLNLYTALAAIEGARPGPTTPEAVSEQALSNGDPLCAEAVAMFCAFLGTVASDLALSLGALGGVYIAGGIVPSWGDAFARSGFRERFESKGRFAQYLGSIPTFVVLHPFPAFIGLRAILDGRTALPGPAGQG